MTESTAKKTDSNYRFEHFDLKIMLSDMRFSKTAMAMTRIDMQQQVQLLGGQSVSLKDLSAGKPLVFITASITCPMTISSLSELTALVDSTEDFSVVFVYVREAHPGDQFPQAQDIETKFQYAKAFKQQYLIKQPIIVDDLSGSLHQTLDTLPNSLHILDTDGSPLFQSLWSGDLPGIKQAFEQIKKGDLKQKTISQKMLMPFLYGAGYMHGVLNQAGKKSYRELMWGAPPVWLLSKTAGMLRFIKPSYRGMVAMLLMLFAVFVVIGILFLR
ncbi:MAG: hypothetical protein M1270_00265 [Gammaproteobacteria bacterium]|nr:hypothetical protein [Gammaproteobacteria bacterium]